jgi:hydroxymethylglutaryl-CoA lyase
MNYLTNSHFENLGSFPKRVKIVEVGPRDGLQAETTAVATETKIDLVNRLSRSGIGNIEAASFVSPKWVPQMSDGLRVMSEIERVPGVIYSALTPNMRGFENAIEANVDEVVIFGSASEAFSHRNLNCSISEGIERLRPVAVAAKDAGLRLRGSISCCFGCPYEGQVDPDSVVEVVQRLKDLGCDEIDLADTVGVGTARKVAAIIERTAKIFPLDRLAGHFHDTYGQGLANILASMQIGMNIFHSSVAGLGGCPYARGATGNVATEDVLYLLHGLGIETGVDLDAIVGTGHFISDAINRPNGSRAGKALLARTAA